MGEVPNQKNSLHHSSIDAPSGASLHLQKYLMTRLEGIAEKVRGLCGEKVRKLSFQGVLGDRTGGAEEGWGGVASACSFPLP